MRIRSRPYLDEHDLRQMLDFVVGAANSGAAGYLRLGDVLWGIYHRADYDPAGNIRLWEDAHGLLLGFAWHEEPDGVVMQVAPRLRVTGALEREMIAWGAAQVDRASPNSDGNLWTRVHGRDTETVALLLRGGWTRDEMHTLKMRRDLGLAIPDPLPGETFTVRPVDDEEEWPARVALNRAVWPGATMTPASYRRLRAAPHYLPELDLVAVAPNGSLVASCICWLDTVNGSGELEPVGTHERFRGQGAGKALMLEGLRRLQALGAHTARVTSVRDNAAATRLYASVGFSTFDIERFYRKPLDELAPD